LYKSFTSLCNLRPNDLTLEPDSGFLCFKKGGQFVYFCGNVIILHIIYTYYYYYYYYLKFQLHPSQHGFIKSKFTATNLVTYLNSITASVSSQGQTDTIYFNLSQAFDKVSHTLLLHKLNNYGLSERYITWFKSYLSYGSSIVRTLGKFSSPLPLLSGVPQGSTLGPQLFNNFINGLCSKIHYLECLFFGDNLKVFRVIKSAKDCKLLKSNIDCVHKWCYENRMKINTLKTNIISFTSKTNSIHFSYYVENLLIVTD
jgi:hypothetical protein